MCESREDKRFVKILNGRLLVNWLYVRLVKHLKLKQLFIIAIPKSSTFAAYPDVTRPGLATSLEACHLNPRGGFLGSKIFML